MKGDGSTKAVVGDRSELGQQEEAAAAAAGQSAAHDQAPSMQNATAAEGKDALEVVELDDAPAVAVSSHAAPISGQSTTLFSSPPGTPDDSKTTSSTPTVTAKGFASSGDLSKEELVLADVSRDQHGPGSPERPTHAQDIDNAPRVLLDAPHAVAASKDHLVQPTHRTSHASSLHSATSGDDDGAVSPTVAFGG